MNSSKQVLLPLTVLALVVFLFNLGLYQVLPLPRPPKTPDAAASFHLDFDQHYEGTGWHVLERDDNLTFEWTAAPVFTLTLPVIGSGPLDVSFGISHRMSEALEASLRLRVNDTDVELHRNGDTFDGLIPGTALADDYTSITLVFETAPPIRPADVNPDSRDMRLLGVGFDWLDIHPHVAPTVQ